MNKNIWIIVILLVISAISVSACGGSSETQPAANTPTPTIAPAETPTVAPAEPTAVPTVAAPTGDADAGATLFAVTCASCHGAKAEGVQGLGAGLHSNEFIKNLSDAELVEYLKVGRPADDPKNTVGIPMPPKGGNPNLTDDDLLDITAFLRTLQ